MKLRSMSLATWDLKSTMTSPCRMWSLGYLVRLLTAIHLHTLDTLKTGTVPSPLSGEATNNVCWICQGWVHIEFKIPRPQVENSVSVNFGNVHTDKMTPPTDLVLNLHLSFDGFKPHRMTEYHEHHHLHPDKIDTSFLLHRMIPPGSLSYFYSVGDLSKI